MRKKELDLFDLLMVLWRKKWIVILGVGFCIAVSGLVSFFMQPVYEIDTILQTGKFLAQDQSGRFTEVLIEDPQQIADEIKHESYNAAIANDLHIQGKHLPTIYGNRIQNTSLVRLWIRDNDVGQSRQILNRLIAYKKEEINKKIDVEFTNIDALIQENEIAIERAKEEIINLRNKLGIIKQRELDINKEMLTIKKNMGELEEAQARALEDSKRSETGTLGLLLYSNEVQQSLQYLGILNEKVASERLNEVTTQSMINNEESKISQLANTIMNLKVQKTRVEYLKIVKDPSPSVDPIYPRKMINMVLAGLLSFVFISLLVLIGDTINTRPS